MIAEIDFSSISVIVAITQRSYGNHSPVIAVIAVTAKIPRCNAFPTARYQDALHVSTHFKMAAASNTKKACDLAVFMEEVQRYEKINIQNL